MKAIIIIFAIAVLALSAALYDSKKECKRYRASALKIGRASHEKDKQLREADNLINKNAADTIVRQNAVIEDLQTRIRQLERINENYKKQLERRP